MPATMARDSWTRRVKHILDAYSVSFAIKFKVYERMLVIPSVGPARSRAACYLCKLLGVFKGRVD